MGQYRYLFLHSENRAPFVHRAPFFFLNHGRSFILKIHDSLRMRFYVKPKNDICIKHYCVPETLHKLFLILKISVRYRQEKPKP